MTLDPIKFRELVEEAIAAFKFGEEPDRDHTEKRLSDFLLSHASELLALVEADQWRPIETAPKDGTEILLGSVPQTFQGNPVPARTTIGHWMTEEECRTPIGDCGGECRCPEYDYHPAFWMSWDGGFTDENPATHWRPLPPPPEPAQ